MTGKLTPQAKNTTSKPAISLSQPGILQRQCDCGGIPGLTGECEECSSKKLSGQRGTNPPALPNTPPDDQPTLQMQRSNLGGHSFSNLAIESRERFGIQTKLTIGQPNDQYEQEADRVADQVMRMPDSALTQVPPANSISSLPIQQLPNLTLQQEIHQEEEEEESKTLQMKKQVGQNPNTTSGLEAQLQASKGKGRPLPKETQSFMESRFGVDFSQVRAHSDADAAQMNQELGAQAFTHRQGVFFGAGKYNPGSIEGKRLLAHELTHVVQQSNSVSQVTPRLQRITDEALVAPYDYRTFVESRLSNREKIDRALESQDPSDVKSISNFSEASETERIQLINILLDQGWVGPSDEIAIERIWHSFGDSLPTVASQNFGLWTNCVERGAELDDLQFVEQIKERFKSDVRQLAIQYLFENREYILQEMEALGISGETTDITEQQTIELQDIQQAAQQVVRAQEAQSQLTQIQVGYRPYYSSVMDEIPSYIPVYFDPATRPPFRSNPGGEDIPLPTWEEVKAQYDRVTSVITGLVNRYPAIYASVREGNAAEIANAESPEQARAVVGNTFQSVLQNIDETVPKIDEEDIEYYDLVPIHDQLFEGTVLAPSQTPWNESFYRWAARDDLSDHESREFWIMLGLGTLAAAAFVVAELATLGSATFFAAAGVGLLASGAQAAISWERYLDLAQAARTNVSDETALVSQGQASAALVDAVLNTVFFFIDAFAPVARGVRGATGAAATTAQVAVRREILAASEQELSEQVGREIAQRETAEQLARETAEEMAAQGLERGGRAFLSVLAQRMRAFIDSVVNWARSVFDNFMFKGYEVVPEGEFLVLYGIRSRVRLAQFRKDSVQRWFIENDEQLQQLRHSRASQLGRARSAAAEGDEALRNLLRGNAVRLSEEIGEEALERIILTEFPNATRLYRGSGSGVLDLVYRLPGGRILIVEAKGGAGRLGTRVLEEGVTAGQGTASYLRDILRQMIRSGGEHETAAREVLHAWRNGNLTYQLGKVRIPQGNTPLTATLKDFRLNPINLTDEAMGL